MKPGNPRPFEHDALLRHHTAREIPYRTQSTPETSEADDRAIKMLNTAPIFLLDQQVRLSNRLDLDRDVARMRESVLGLIVANRVEGKAGR